MTLLILFLLCAMLAGVALLGEQQLPWASKLRRMNAGSPTQAEWLAPDTVLEQVREDYKRATRWLQDVALQGYDVQLADADSYLTGTMLADHTERINRYRTNPKPLCGVLRADHVVGVRHFSADGERCVVVDVQVERRMATYHRATGERVGTQHMADATLVYQMQYDREAACWKIAAFIQVLPAAWQHGRTTGRVRLQPELNTTAGRDY